MVRRWLLTLAILAAMLTAPLAMASERAHPAPDAQVTSHCADTANQAGGDRDKPAPTKQFRCMGACFGVEAGALRLPARVVQRVAMTAIPTMTSLGDVLVDHELPPPRRA